MGDSEAMAAQTPTIDNNDGSINATLDVGKTGEFAAPSASSVVEDVVTPSATSVAANVTNSDPNAGAVVVSSTDVNSLPQEGPTPMAHDASENPAIVANPPTDSSQVADYNALVNGENESEIKNVASAAVAENGITTDSVHGSADVHESLDASALSAEEERLWSIVRANSLEFNAWTALIEETEKTSEGNIMKIRKVYDAFLAEFPLCYGYWKKYADHEARLGTIEKVVEVYERAVLGVTYSVDMWLHYCVFAISVYGDPDTVRRV